ncbi:hypothetical protein EXU48_07580 [Occultella glacieicola]|uniref:LysM domain-containing protein n=1 Tax=Occultella glacieicola TaxID=2518684 RepID=A0ABY2E7T1_9MICO|nr:hypothetical protein [Occultella glacieicola]TDE96088.1 hypothetical protein EXU48_07580 [Occultella glacieicola]
MRRVLLTLGVAGTTGGVAAWLATAALPAAATPRSVDQAIALGLGWCALGVLAWYCVSALLGLACLAARALGRGRGWRSGERALGAGGAPFMARMASVGVGAALAAGALVVPAQAVPEPDGAAIVSVDVTWGAGSDPDDGATDPGEGTVGPDLTWGANVDANPTTEPAPAPVPAPTGDPTPTPSSASSHATETGPAAEPGPATEPGSATEPGPVTEPNPPAEPAPTTEPDPAADDAPAAEPMQSPDPVPASRQPAEPPGGDPAEHPDAAHVVAPGESLWSIAADALAGDRPDVTDADIAAAWPRWYSANAETIGPEPDLIHPGQELVPPANP